MDEEKQSKNGQTQESPKSALNKGIKKKASEGIKKFFKTIIAPIIPILLKFLVYFLIGYILIASIKNFIDGEDSTESKEAAGSAIVYKNDATGSLENNKINVSINNVTNDGAYKLTYQFSDENGNVLPEGEAIAQIKSNLLEENEKIELDKFSDSELKIIGSLMYEGLETGKYNEEELKALAIFVKADIAGKSFDLREKREEVTVKDLSKNDEVYGTIELHRTTATVDEDGKPVYKRIKLKYVSYDTLKNLIRQGSNEALEKFSVDENGYLVIAKANSTTMKFTYQSEGGATLSEADMAKINQGYIREDLDEYVIKEYPLTVNYMQYIKKYIASYGILTDLLIETNNVDFCLEIAELALNSKIVINIREEQVDTYTYNVTNYTQTTLLYDYVTYDLTGYEVTGNWKSIASGSGNPRNSATPSNYGWSPSLGYAKNGQTYVYEWSNGGSSYNSSGKYRLIYTTSSYSRWTLYKMDEKKTKIDSQTGSSLIVGGHITKAYDGYTIDEDYTAEEIFKYKLIEETTTRNYKYEIDISEINCWYVIYKKQYSATPSIEKKEIPAPEDVDGQFPQNATVLLDTTNDSSIINNDVHVRTFIQNKKNEFMQSNSRINKVEGGATTLKIEQKSKTDSNVSEQEYKGERTRYYFTDESDIDTTEVQLKNVEYVNGEPAFTPEGEKGFLYIYDKYMTMEVDLHLQNDAEKRFFELLEADADTAIVSDIMKFLLYVYDGIDRGVTDIGQSFKIIDMSLTSFNSNNVGSVFGCDMTREEFITLAQADGESILSGLAPQIYDICLKYNVNPCITYGWAALESGFGESAVDDKNLFPMGSYNGATSGFRYDSYEDSIEDFCKWVVNAADLSTSAYSQNISRAEEYETVNSKYKGLPEKNIYVLFSRYSWVGDTHTPDARACIKNTYDFLNDGVYDCNHADEDETTLKERADYMQYQIELRIKIAEDVFDENVFVSVGGEYESINDIVTSGGDEGVLGFYTSTSERKYKEWSQGRGAIGSAKLYTEGYTMGEYGCRSICLWYISFFCWN